MKQTYLLSIIIFSVFLLSAGCNNSRDTKKKDTADSTDKFADNIRKTEFQSPEEERRGFKLPPGFEITLFASEPDISKPINMEFDDRGRLWVTTTIEYPKPAAPGRGRDKIIILEDTDGDGKADKFIPFVDSLNIPIGITTINNGAIAYSIPNVYKFIDKNGDGKADETTKLLGPFEFLDTHGMVNNLVRGFDGWIYACHGFANTSTVAGADGDSIHMASGNTFRFREDGSRVEATTFGRVNPFGYAYDEWGYLYSLDCHTKPIYQLINGAQYPAQGVKEPSIGWAPFMMSYEFGSTANSGLVYYTGSQFPEAYYHNFYSGNVVTSRINRNTMSLHGSTPESKREEDFLLSADPWFRPVDIKTGPDGSMYVADFYNRIIGHYEVPKDHPQRDKTSGRIWKITYTGAGKKTQLSANKDWSKATLDELIKALNNPQLNSRMMIANCVVDIHGQKAVTPVQQMMAASINDNKSFIQGLWILDRLHALPNQLLEKALQHSDPMIQVHALRVLAGQKIISAKHRSIAISALQNKNPHVQRMAITVLGHFPEFNQLQSLIAINMATDTLDTHMAYTSVLSIKDHLNNSAIMHQVTTYKWNEKQLGVLMNVLPVVPSKEAAFYALAYLENHNVSEKKLADNLEYIGRYISADKLNKLITVARKNAAGNLDIEYNFYDAIKQGMAQKGTSASSSLKDWGSSLAKEFLKNIHDSSFRQVRAAKIAADYKMLNFEPDLKTLLTTKSVSSKGRIAAAEALMAISPERNLPIVSGVFTDANEPVELREKLTSTMGSVQSPLAFAMYEKSLKGAPRTLQVNVSTILASSAEGINSLLRALKAGNIKSDIMEENSVKEQLIANIQPDQRKLLGTLTEGKMGVENRKDLITARLQSYNPGAVNIDSGRHVFIKNCNICHSIGNAEGGNIGPKLSGIGTWGQVALTEKILNPNANISEAYRNYTIKLQDGKSLTGLYRRDEGQVSVFADLTGQEFSIPKVQIKEKIPSKYTLMPDNFRNTITKKDFDALIKYLLSIKENK